MANTYYDSDLTAGQIDLALKAISDVIVPANNGKILVIQSGKIKAKSAGEIGQITLETLNVVANGDYTPEAGVDGFDEVHVAVPNSYSASDEGKVVNNGALVAQTARASQITQNGTYDTTLNDEVTVNVSGGGSAVVQPLSVAQNGTYNPPSGVDGYAPVTVSVPSGGEIVPLVATENGSYTPPSGVDGYSPVSVLVDQEFALGYHSVEQTIPQMTSNTAPYGEASSSQYIFSPWLAFNRVQAASSMQQGWLAAAGAINAWLQYKWPFSMAAKKFDILEIYTANNSTTEERSFTVEGSLDGITWENCLKYGQTIHMLFLGGTYGNNCFHYVFELNGKSYYYIKITEADGEPLYGGVDLYACTFSEVQVYSAIEEGTIILKEGELLGRYGTSVPSNTMGDNGELYFLVNSSDVAQSTYKKQNGVWVQL